MMHVLAHLVAAAEGGSLGGLPASDQLVRRRLGEQRVALPPHRPHWPTPYWVAL